MRAKVVGEGGNLGFTQRGRIEYARAGGRINTDFIDNSAGVDTSDHEVNWKILLGLAIQRGELTLEERNDLLQDCAPDVVQHVLYDNYLQAQILSQEEGVSAQRIEAYEELMQQLEADGELERAVEFMPTTDDMAERRAAGQGMTRPELAVLLAYAKRQVYAELLESDLPDTEYLAADLARYFPPRIVERFGHLIADHPLKRQIIATMASNDVVNSQGITFASRMVTETGASPSEVVRAFRIARDVTGATARWSDVEALDGLVDPALQSELMSGVDWLVETTARWYLVQAAGQLLLSSIGVVPRVVRRGVGGDQSDRPRRVAGGARAGGAAPDRGRGAGVRSRIGMRSSPSSCTRRTSSPSRTRPAERRSRSRAGSSCSASGSTSTGSSSSSRSCRPPLGGSGGRSSRWRMICSRCAASCVSGCSNSPAAPASTRRSSDSSRTAPRHASA